MSNQADIREMIDLFEAELRLCRLDSSQRLAVLSEGENLKDYAEAFLHAGDNLGAETAHVHLASANTAGADVVYELEQLDGPPPRCILAEYGYPDTPGRWDHWPGGFLASTGTATGVEGRAVMDAGDLILPRKEVVQTPIGFTIKDGYITGIDGGADARRLTEYMESFDDPRAFAVSHIGWGLNEDAKWDVTLPGICMDGRAYYGNVLFSTGPNTEFGGDNDTTCHLDLPMKNCSLWLDNDMIVKDGEVIPEDMRA